MDKEEIKKALDAFEKDEFTDAKEILSKGIKSKRNEKLKSKLELESDIEPVEDDDSEDDDEE